MLSTSEVLSQGLFVFFGVCYLSVCRFVSIRVSAINPGGAARRSGATVAGLRCEVRGWKMRINEREVTSIGN